MQRQYLSSFRAISRSSFLRRFSTSHESASFDPKHSRLVILGAGFSGLVASAYIPKITKMKNFEIRVLDSKTNMTYIPSLDLLPFNIRTIEQVEKPIYELLDNAINIDFSSVESINPKNNTIVTTAQKEYTYDHLVLAPGLTPSINEVAGLQEALEDRDSAVVSTLTGEDALKYKRKLETFVAGNVIVYNDRRSKVYEAGLNQTLLLNAFLREKRGPGLRKMSNVQYITNARTIFPNAKQSLRIQDILREKEIDYDNFSLKLVEVDAKNKKAIFQDSSNNRIEKPYDLLFVNPEHNLPNSLQSLADPEGNLNIDPETLIHTQYSNVLALGHCTRNKQFIPSRKSILEQGIIMAYNLRSLQEAALKSPHAKPERLVRFSGATEIPLFVEPRQCLTARIDPKNPDNLGAASMIKYLKEVYAAPELYFRLLPRGLWFEETGFRVPALNTL